jgi:type IV pilus assembly protein PilV
MFWLSKLKSISPLAFIVSRRILKQQSGVTLIEVLVSILVLSVGLLGMLGMQAGSMRFEQGAWVRSAVSAAVADFSDGIRMLPNALPTEVASVRTYATELAATEDNDYFVPDKDCNSTNCTPAEFASFQRVSWRRGINGSFPGGVGFIEQAGVAGQLSQTYTLTIAWADKSLVGSDGSASAAPTCVGTEALAAARNCCPSAISAPAGIRCTRVVVLP